MTKHFSTYTAEFLGLPKVFFTLLLSKLGVYFFSLKQSTSLYSLTFLSLEINSVKISNYSGSYLYLRTNKKL